MVAISLKKKLQKLNNPSSCRVQPNYSPRYFTLERENKNGSNNLAN